MCPSTLPMTTLPNFKSKSLYSFFTLSPLSLLFFLLSLSPIPTNTHPFLLSSLFVIGSKQRTNAIVHDAMPHEVALKGRYTTMLLFSTNCRSALVCCNVLHFTVLRCVGSTRHVVPILTVT